MKDRKRRVVCHLVCFCECVCVTWSVSGMMNPVLKLTQTSIKEMKSLRRLKVTQPARRECECVCFWCGVVCGVCWCVCICVCVCVYVCVWYLHCWHPSQRKPTPLADSQKRRAEPALSWHPNTSCKQSQLQVNHTQQKVQNTHTQHKHKHLN